MFKKIMSDFAYNRVLEKYRKIGKTQPSVVVASLLETQATETYPTNCQSKIDNLLLEMVNEVRTKIITGEIDVDSTCVACAAYHAVKEKDVQDDFITAVDITNQVKILVNLKLLPERFLSINFDEEVVA